MKNLISITKSLVRIKLVALIITSGFLFNTDVLAQEKTKDVPTREQIEEQYKWNLEDVYKSPEDWEKDFNWVKEASGKCEKFEGTLGSSAQKLLECLKFSDEVEIKVGKLYLYASLAKDLDLSNPENQSRFERIMSLYSQVSAASSFIRPEILSISEEKLWKFVEEEKGLAVYKHLLEDLLRMKPHTLSPGEEEILALAGPATSVAYSTFGMFNNADIQFPTVEGEDGTPIKISHARYGAAMYSLNRDYRKRVYKGYYKPFMEYKNTLVSLFNGNIKSNIFYAKTRKYNSNLEAALTPNNIPVSVYNNLISTVNENLEPLHRWAKIKKKMLEIEELHPYDTYVTLFPSVKKKYDYEESKKILLEALKPLGEDYINNLKMAFENRWIDVYETKGKRSGAYSSGTTYGVHPYVLLNWADELDDLFTFAHEMGHNMHSYYTEQNQPFPYANYSIFVAEVASTMNEALLLDYLIDNAETKMEKLALIEKNLTNIVTTFYRQTRFAEFEKLVNEKTEKGDALTPDKLCNLYQEMYQRYWGDEMTVDEEETYTWARIPHFYYNFYVYQYATSFAASQALAAKVIKEGKPAIDKYLNFLKSGSSKYPIDVLKEAGVDMTSPEPVKAVVSKMNELLDKMEKLLDE